MLDPVFFPNQLPIFSQQYIYLKTGLKQGMVSDINPNTITFKSAPAYSSPVTVPTKEAILLFNENGDFLVPNKMDFNNTRIQQELKQFLSPGSNSRVSDRIYLQSKIGSKGIS